MPLWPVHVPRLQHCAGGVARVSVTVYGGSCTQNQKRGRRESARESVTSARSVTIIDSRLVR